MNLIFSQKDNRGKTSQKKLPDLREVRGFLRFSKQKLDAYCNLHAIFPEVQKRRKVKEFFLQENREPLLFELRILDGFWKLDCAGETERIGRLGLISGNPHTHAALNLYHQLREEIRSDRPVCLEDVRTVYARCYLMRESDRKKTYEEEPQPSFVVNPFNSLSRIYNIPLGYHIEKHKPKKALKKLVFLKPRTDIPTPEIAPFSMINELNSFAACSICERGILKALTDIGTGCKLSDPKEEIFDALLVGDRAAVVAALISGGLKRLSPVLDKYGYSYIEIGKTTNGKDIIIECEGLRVLDLPIPFLLGYTMFDYAMMHDILGIDTYHGPKRLSKRSIVSAYTEARMEEKDTDLSNVGKLVYIPYGGKYRLTPSQVFGTVRQDKKAFLTSAQSFEGIIQSPFLEGVYSVVTAVGKLVAAGVAPNHIRIDCNLPYVDSGKDKGKEFLYRLGVMYARNALFCGVFANDPNEPGNNIKNIIAGGVAQTDKLITNLYRPGKKIFRLPLKRDVYGMPDFKYLKKLLTTVSINIENGNITAASAAEQSALSEIIKSCLGENCGFSLANADTGILQPSYGDLIASVEDINELSGIESEYLGITDASGMIKGAEVEVKLSEMHKRNDRQACLNPKAPIIQTGDGKPGHLYSGQKKYSPVVYLPVFDQTAGWIERSFIGCGGTVDAHILNPGERDFFIEIRKRIEKSDILVFSSAYNKNSDMKKIITEFCSRPVVMDAIHELLYRREGLILAFGEAFYSLIELGFLPYGRYMENTSQSFLLTRNTDEHPLGRIARAKLTSVRSPWLSSCREGAVFAALSQGNGIRLTVEENALASLIRGEQICSQYIDPEGGPALSAPYNPSGNTAAIESLCSPDGRIFGAAGHNYKVADVLNAGENYDLQLFGNGIRYFR